MAEGFAEERRQFATLLGHLRSSSLVIVFGNPGDGKADTARAGLEALKLAPVALNLASEGQDLLPVPVLNEAGDNYQMVPDRRLLQVIRGERALLLGDVEIANPAQMAVIAELRTRTKVVGTWTTPGQQVNPEMEELLAFGKKYNALLFNQDLFMANPKFREAGDRCEGDFDKLLGEISANPESGAMIFQGGGLAAALKLADAEVAGREI